MSAVELTVILKDSERSYRHKFLIYDAFLMEVDAPTVKECINEAKKHFNAEPEDITIRTMMVIQ